MPSTLLLLLLGALYIKLLPLPILEFELQFKLRFAFVYFSQINHPKLIASCKGWFIFRNQIATSSLVLSLIFRRIKNLTIMQVQTISSALSSISVVSSHDERDVQASEHRSVTAPPFFIKQRIEFFEQLKSEYFKDLSERKSNPITISLADSRTFEGESLLTTPLDIAKLAFGNKVADTFIVSKVNGHLFDITRKLEVDCSIEFFDFNSQEGQSVFWHSSAHVLGEACEHKYSCLLCHGPPTEDGFHYDMKIPDGQTVNPLDFPQLMNLATKFIKENQPFERLEMSKEDLLKMFSYNPYKIHFIREKIPDMSSSTVYRCGDLIDLCMGPHIPHTGLIKAFQVTKNSSSYFLGDAAKDSLQRIYGVSFPDIKLLKEYLNFKEEAERRDHRRLGKEHQLFFFHELSPGSCFFLPYGARIYNSLIELMRGEYRKRGFLEVLSPNFYNVNLWKTSGHWENYQENMFSFEIEKELYALKPMNCPGHCLMFAHRERSYRELPLRLADFGVLHRNELSGALTGLTRVRRFQQDDAHIFCRTDQISTEIQGCLAFLDAVYSILGFTYSLKLSTRPEKFLGEIETWNAAEKQLEDALRASGKSFELNPGDGAFYGPKIDITLTDAQRRRHQCATIQLDFQLPQRFNLSFRSASHDETAMHERPVIIHRAILGSLERMIAILTENYAGKWPFWLSPRQVMIVPVSAATFDYATRISQQFVSEGIHAEVDTSDVTLNKKIRNAETSHFNYVFVVGQSEEDSNSVNIRKATPEGKDKVCSIDVALSMLLKMKQLRSKATFLPFDG